MSPEVAWSTSLCRPEEGVDGLLPASLPRPGRLQHGLSSEAPGMPADGARLMDSSGDAGRASTALSQPHGAVPSVESFR